MADIPFEDKIYIVDKILSSTKENLRNRDYVIALIREMGLHNDSSINHLYSPSEQAFLKQFGMLQQPQQLADALIFLSNFVINKYIEIGTFNGTCFAFIASYLKVFNPGIKSRTIDIMVRHNPLMEVEFKKRIDIKFHTGTSDDFIGAKSDLCFIDADHSYSAVVKDYENIGKYAKLCMFHDIIDEHQTKINDGGSLRHWKELKENENECEYHEFIDHPENKSNFGIGIKI